MVRRKRKKIAYISKPEAACQGKGIAIVTNLDDLKISSQCIV
jgi:predicted ATP-grasp superfamily ATP-dependent carboligase